MMVDASKIEMPLLNIAFLELKQVSAFCAGALACSRDREATQVIEAIHASINNILKNICGNVDEVVKDEVKNMEIKEHTVQDIPLEELYLDLRLLNCIKQDLIANERDKNPSEEPRTYYYLSDIMAQTLKYWLKVPGLGKKSLAQLYWKCHDLGATFSMSGISYPIKKYINSCKHLSEKQNG